MAFGAAFTKSSKGTRQANLSSKPLPVPPSSPSATRLAGLSSDSCLTPPFPTSSSVSEKSKQHRRRSFMLGALLSGNSASTASLNTEVVGNVSSVSLDIERSPANSIRSYGTRPPSSVAAVPAKPNTYRQKETASNQQSSHHQWEDATRFNEQGIAPPGAGSSIPEFLTLNLGPSTASLVPDICLGDPSGEFEGLEAALDVTSSVIPSDGLASAVSWDGQLQEPTTRPPFGTRTHTPESSTSTMSTFESSGPRTPKIEKAKGVYIYIDAAKTKAHTTMPELEAYNPFQAAWIAE